MIINASQLKDLKSMIIGMNSSKEIQTDGDDTVKIIDVAGNVETTANSDINNSSEMQTQDRDSQSVQEQTSDINSTENQSDDSDEKNAGNPSDIADNSNQPGETEQVTTTQPEPEPTVAPVVKEPQYYIVKPGDSLYSISLKIYGNIDMINSIKQANSITNENYIKEGDTILLP